MLGDGSGGLVSENRSPMYSDHLSKTLSFSNNNLPFLSFMHPLELLFLVLPVMTLMSSCILLVPLFLLFCSISSHWGVGYGGVVVPLVRDSRTFGWSATTGPHCVPSSCLAPRRGNARLGHTPGNGFDWPAKRHARPRY